MRSQAFRPSVLLTLPAGGMGLRVLSASTVPDMGNAGSNAISPIFIVKVLQANSRYWTGDLADAFS
jgi:hypothetical protein